MINTEDQDQLFTLIANYLKTNIRCVAIGGTAMMFLGYKNTTKDIDLVFDTNDDKNIFVKAIQELGYKKQSLADIYDKKRQALKEKPEMYTRGDERFDLFVHTIFGFQLTTNDEFIERRDYISKNELIIQLPNKETLILLKAITRRPKDHEDIETILRIEKNINWEEIIRAAIQQKKNNPWILIDLEETVQKLKAITFIPKKYFEMIYKAQK